MPVHRIQYGKVLQLQVQLSEPRLLLFAEEDGRIFLGQRRARHWRAYRHVGRLHQSGGVPTTALSGQAVGERHAEGAQRHDRRRQGGNAGDKQQGSRRRPRVGADLLHSSAQAAGRGWVDEDCVPPHSD